jgi:hypothetical protein
MHQFNLNVVNPRGIVLDSMDIRVGPLGPSAQLGFELYITPGGYRGKELDPQEWAFMAGVSYPIYAPGIVPVDFQDFLLPQGVWGIAVYVGPNVWRYWRYETETWFGVDVDLSGATLIRGRFNDPLMLGLVETTWDGRINYCSESGRVSDFCLSNLSANGCWPEVQTNGTPTVSAAPGSVQISASQVPNNTGGVFLYSLASELQRTLGSGMICLQQPIVASFVKSGGIPGPVQDCSGSFDFDLGAEIATNPALQVVGRPVYCQFVYRESRLPTFNVTTGQRFSVAP